QGSLALWNITERSAAQDLTTAEFAVSVKSGEGTTQYLTEADGVVTLAGQNNLLPGESRTTAIRLGNATEDRSGTFRSRVTERAPLASGELKNHLSLNFAKASGGDCSRTTQESTAVLAQDQSALYCQPTALSATALASLSGSNGTVSLPLGSAQL